VAVNRHGGGWLGGRVALVTGAGGAIGRAIALRLAAEGATVAAAGRTEKTVEQTRALLVDRGATAAALTADLTSATGCHGLVDDSIRRFGRLDILVNCAGVHGELSIDEVTEEEWDRIFAVNTKSMFFTLQAAARVMLPAGGGRVVNFSSIAGRGFRRSASAPYVGAKAAVIAITRLAALRLAPSITVNCVVPGVTVNSKYEMRVRARANAIGVDEATARSAMEDFIPLHRSNTPADVAGVVAFLVSDDARNITGQSINVDGGLIYDAGY
jgi:NAD(P)-dependent dehydrogenase (short-subunit alcohol dehydrogenase family)